MYGTKKLDSYVKQYADNIQLCTIGEVENANSVNKGGMYRRYKNKTKHKNKSKSRTYKYKKYRKLTKKYKKRRITYKKYKSKR